MRIEPVRQRRKIAAISVVAVVICAFAIVAAAHTEAAYRASVEKWRADHEAQLKSDTGWLTVADLFWPHEGENRFGSDPLNDIVLPSRAAPAEAGTIVFHAGKAVVHVKPGAPVMIRGKRVDTAPLRPDSDPAFDELTRSSK